MITPVHLTISLDPASVDAALLSLRAVLEQPVFAGDPAQGVVDPLAPPLVALIDGVTEGGTLFVVEGGSVAAGGATVLQPLKIAPSEWYTEFFATFVASRFDADAVRIVHGWPVLSVGGAIPTVAETGGAASIPGGGAA